MIFFPDDPIIWRLCLGNKLRVPASSINHSACPMFQLLARWVWFTLQEAEQSRTSVGEESITDMLLLTLAYYCQKQVTVHKFKRNEESTNGADWEWWIKKNNTWLPMRVQAKRIDVDTQSYPQLDKKGKGRTGRQKLQVNCLIDKAQNLGNGGPRQIPIYCFYNYFHTNNVPDTNNIEYGCAVASAYKIKKLIRPKPVKRHRDDVSQILHPWHKLVCDWKSHDDIKKALVPARLIKKFKSVTTDALPGYVSRLIKKKDNAVYQQDQAINDLAGIVVIDCDIAEHLIAESLQEWFE
jgi:hypothetical protein